MWLLFYISSTLLLMKATQMLRIHRNIIIEVRNRNYPNWIYIFVSVWSRILLSFFFRNDCELMWFVAGSSRMWYQRLRSSHVTWKLFEVQCIFTFSYLTISMRSTFIWRISLKRYFLSFYQLFSIDGILILNNYNSKLHYIIILTLKPIKLNFS